MTNYTTCGFTKLTVSTSSCSGDSFGQSCSCCMGFKAEGTSGSLGYCTYGQEWDSDKLEDYAWETKEFTRLAFFAIIAVFMFLSRL